MTKKTTAKVERNAKTGRFTIVKDGGAKSDYAAGKTTPKTVSSSISKNRDALKRLADR